RRRQDLEAFVRLNGGLDGRPEIAYDWDSIASYLDRFDRGVAVNVALMVGNSALRIEAIGWEETPAGAPALDRMRASLREAMEEGAYGLSSGLDYPPGSYASTEELAQPERLADPRVRERRRAEVGHPGAASTSTAGWADIRLGYFARPANQAWEGRTLADYIAETESDAVDAICDLLLEEDLRVSQVTSGPTADTLPRFVAHPAGMVGTDSTFVGAKPSPRTYGSFPRILGEFVREKRIMG